MANLQRLISWQRLEEEMYKDMLEDIMSLTSTKEGLIKELKEKGFTPEELGTLELSIQEISRTCNGLRKGLEEVVRARYEGARDA